MLKFETILSGNTFGAIYWTDGKRETPMLPEEPWMMKSPAEAVLFWQDECREVRQFFPFEEPANTEWQGLEYAEEPGEHDYLRALDTGMGSTPEKLLYLRRQLWWAANDRLRRGISERNAAFCSEEFVNNLRALADLLDDSQPESRLMHAEVRRELGEFERALALLATDYPPKFTRAIEAIRRLAADRDRFVQRLEWD